MPGISDSGRRRSIRPGAPTMIFERWYRTGILIVTDAIRVELRQGEAITRQSSAVVDDVDLIRADDWRVYDLGGERWIIARGTWIGHQVTMSHMAGGSAYKSAARLKSTATP
jgi:hypothetical protein